MDELKKEPGGQATSLRGKALAARWEEENGEVAGKSLPVDPFHSYWSLFDNLLGLLGFGATFHTPP